MSFYSFTFALFFAVVVTLYYLAPQRGRVPTLLAASALFYISFNPQYIFILLALIAVDYCAGLLIEQAESKHATPFGGCEVKFSCQMLRKTSSRLDEFRQPRRRRRVQV